MAIARQKVTIGNADYWLTTDEDYGKHIGDRFEPNTTALLQALCNPDDTVLDVGANIGVTALLFAGVARHVVAVEPVRLTFEMLEQNVKAAGVRNVRMHNFALGHENGTVKMQGNPHNLSGAFIADRHSFADDAHFTEEVALHRLDDVFSSMGLDRLDVLKIDVEGYEVDVLIGAKRVLAEHQPVVVLEMNYVALNLWRRMSVPEFRDELLVIFPYVYAVQEGEWRNFRDTREAHAIQIAHLTKWAYMDIVAGFDERTVLARLERLGETRCRMQRDSEPAQAVRV